MRELTTDCIYPGTDKRVEGPVLDSCKIIYLPKILDRRGNLTFIEGNNHVPFEIKRVFYLYDVPGGEERGGHAHEKMEQFLIAMSGSFDVILDNGTERVRVHMNRSYYGLYIGKKIWREMDNFSSGAVCLSLASTYFEESDYFREYDEFVKYVNRA